MNKNTKRLNLELSEQARERLEKLKDISDLSSFTDVVKRALVLYEKCLDIQKQGGKIILQSKDDSQTELIII